MYLWKGEEIKGGNKLINLIVYILQRKSMEMRRYQFDKNLQASLIASTVLKIRKGVVKEYLEFCKSWKPVF